MDKESSQVKMKIQGNMLMDSFESDFELLAVVEVAPDKRVSCQYEGCDRPVYKKFMLYISRALLRF